jgi:hypothetical protein
MNSIEQDKLSFMMASLREVQDTIRAYDTKAQIVGVGYIFAVGIITNLGTRIPNMPDFGLLAVFLAWLLFIVPIVLFGAVLYPTRKVAPVVGEQSCHPAKVYYVEPEHIAGVDAYIEAMNASDPKIEIAYEILRTAGLREIKRRRFLRGLWAAALSLMLLFLGHLLRTEGALPV